MLAKIINTKSILKKSRPNGAIQMWSIAYYFYYHRITNRNVRLFRCDLCLPLLQAPLVVKVRCLSGSPQRSLMTRWNVMCSMWSNVVGGRGWCAGAAGGPRWPRIGSLTTPVVDVLWPSPLPPAAQWISSSHVPSSLARRWRRAFHGIDDDDDDDDDDDVQVSSSVARWSQGAGRAAQIRRWQQIQHHSHDRLLLVSQPSLHCLRADGVRTKNREYPRAFSGLLSFVTVYFFLYERFIWAVFTHSSNIVPKVNQNNWKHYMLIIIAWNVYYSLSHERRRITDSMSVQNWFSWRLWSECFRIWTLQYARHDC